MIVLAGDIGGTKTHLGIAVSEPGGSRLVYERRFPSSDWPEFLPLARAFLAEAGARGLTAPEVACLAVAGPVQEQRVAVTNLPWVLDARQLSTTLGIARVRLINDFEAAGEAVAGLGPEQVVVLQRGQSRARATRAVLGAGTGLGQALLLWHEDGYVVHPTEGGHVDFAPTTEAQAGLWRYLVSRRGRASYEDVLSGPGLVSIYRYLCSQSAVAARALLAAPDPAAAVAAAALQGEDALADQALSLFVEVYGAQAGNLALTSMALGGIFLAGGIAPKILPRLQSDAFIRAFRSKAPMQGLLERVPVRVVTEPKLGLLGAVAAARRA